MPNCFSLTPKSETEPASLVQVDVEICKHFNEPVDPEKWYLGWYNTIGLQLAFGKSFEEIIEYWEDSATTPGNPFHEYDLRCYEIATFLSKNYTADAWAER